MGVFNDNSKLPGQIEFNRGWKADNNAGCLCNCIVPQTGSCVTIVQRFTRYDQSANLISEKDCQSCFSAIADCLDIVPTNSCVNNI